MKGSERFVVTIPVFRRNDVVNEMGNIEVVYEVIGFLLVECYHRGGGKAMNLSQGWAWYGLNVKAEPN